MSSKPLTFAQFERFAKAIQHDLRTNSESLRALRMDSEQLRYDFGVLTKNIDNLTRSIDGYVKQTQEWRLEQEVLRNRVVRLEKALLSKRLVTQEELAA